MKAVLTPTAGVGNGHHPVRPRRIAIVFGTRPEAIKVAPVIRDLAGDPDIEPVVVVTGQHRGLLDPVLDFFGIEADIDLGVFRVGQSLNQIAGRALLGLDDQLAEADVDAIVVQGDTTTTMAGALAGFYLQIPVAHLEAGLRTNDRLSPYPEEVNRRITTTVSDLHFAPTTVARGNLVDEGISQTSIVVTGNTVIDALHWAVQQRSPYGDAALEAVDASDSRVVLVTTHRRESWGERMAGTARALRRIVDTHPDVVAVLPMHLNPIVRQALEPELGSHPRILLREPMSYGPFARLLGRADLVLTDSGGIQEEAPSLGKPVLVMRDTTERPEALAAGCAELVGTDEETIVAAATRLLGRLGGAGGRAMTTSPYGDGRAASRVVSALRRLVGLPAQSLPEFSFTYPAGERMPAPATPRPQVRSSQREPAGG